MADQFPPVERKPYEYDPGAAPGEQYDLGPMPRSGSDGGASIYIPMQAEDQRRDTRRRYRLIIIVILGLLGGGYWVYKRSVDPIHALESYDAGARQFQAAQYQQAILMFDRVIALKPDLVDAYVLRGRSNVALSKPLQAIPDFSKAIALQPQNPDGYLDRGAVRLELEEFQDALTDATRAIQLNPKLAAAYNLRGATLRKLGKLDEALQDFNRAVELLPNMDNYFQRGATYELLGQHMSAVSDFNEVIAFEPLNSQAYFARAKAFRDMGDTESAERDHRLGRILDGR